MPELTSDKQIFTLLEVTKSIQKTISERYKNAFWVKAEMNKLNYYSQSGHCFPELIEKSDGKVIAQIKSTLWRDDYKNINRNFLQTLKEPLKDGIKILFLAKISFDPSFGLSLQILDIDPSYTLGDLHKEKQETIDKLHQEGLFYKNKEVRFPMLPQRIAIISVESSKGYGDFVQIIDSNSWQYKFFHLLFPSMLQGEKAVPGIINQLKRIQKVSSHFDVVAIIRGGGGDVGLSCYNNFELAKAIATFPIPIITGIGHVTNETVCEMVSYQNEITPSKIAEFLIQKFHNFSVPVDKAREILIDKSRRLLREENKNLQSLVRLFRSVNEISLIKNTNEIDTLKNSLTQQTQFLIKNKTETLKVLKQQIAATSKNMINIKGSNLIQYKNRLVMQSKAQVKASEEALDNLERHVANLDPINILKRGFSITLHNGKVIKDPAQIYEGQVIETKIYNGQFESVVTNKKATNGGK